MRRFGDLAIACVVVSAITYAQTFEVASVKRNTSLANNSLLRILPGGRLTATSFTGRNLVIFAWQLAPYEVAGGPPWFSSDGYDINAKLEGEYVPVAPGTGRVDPLQMAVRNLLADRFKMKTHRETREMDIYALVMAKPGGAPGPKLIQSPKDCAAQAAAAPGGVFPPAVQGPIPALGTPYCGIFGGGGRIRFGGLNSTMMASALEGRAQRRVVDRTGLAGSWDFELTFAPERRGPDGAADANLPDFFTAIQEQLGLKLESTKGPVDVLVIDSVEKPVDD